MIILDALSPRIEPNYVVRKANDDTVWIHLAHVMKKPTISSARFQLTHPFIQFIFVPQTYASNTHDQIVSSHGCSNEAENIYEKNKL